MAKKRKDRIDFGKMEPLTQTPFGNLGSKLGLEVSERDRGSESEGEARPAPDRRQTEKLPGSNPILLVRLEKRPGNKVVTCIHHVQADGKSLLMRLKKRLATGGTFRGGIVEIQGDHRKASAAFLEESGFRVRIGT